MVWCSGVLKLLIYLFHGVDHYNFVTGLTFTIQLDLMHVKPYLLRKLLRRPIRPRHGGLRRESTPGHTSLMSSRPNVFQVKRVFFTSIICSNRQLCPHCRPRRNRSFSARVVIKNVTCAISMLRQMLRLHILLVHNISGMSQHSGEPFLSQAASQGLLHHWWPFIHLIKFYRLINILLVFHTTIILLYIIFFTRITDIVFCSIIF